MSVHSYWIALTDEDRQAVIDSMPGAIDGFRKSWGWMQFAQAIEEKCREKNTIPDCPFCGADAPIALDDMDGTTHYIHCALCGASGPECLSLNLAIEAWKKAPRSEGHQQYSAQEKP